MRWARPVGALALAGLLAVGAAPALAQDATPPAGQTGALDLTNAPVDMHEGTCANPTLDPWTEIGRLQRQRFAGVDETLAPGAGPFTDLAEISEDADDDGALDEGEDLNANAAIDTGFDVDEDDVLDVDEIVDEGEAAIIVVNLPTVWNTRGVIDAPFEPIFTQENVIAVHQSSDQYETIVACANVGGLAYEGDEVVVGLNPVDGSGIRGYAVFEYDSVLFGNDQTRVSVYLFSGLPTERDYAARATPTP
jgi:hypothetical protein